jgi:hypothetical protein
LYGENGFRDDNEFAGEKEIVDADDRACQGIFDGSEESVGGAFFDGAEGVMEGPRSWRAASSLKAPGSPWKAMRICILGMSAALII